MKVYRALFKELKPFVNFRPDFGNLTPWEKGRIRRYANEKAKLEARRVKVFRATGKNLTSAQQYAQHRKGFPGFKVAFVPVANPHEAKISVRRGKLTIREKHVQRRIHFFADYGYESDDFTEDPTKLIQVIRKILRRDRKSQRFHVLAGRYEISDATYPRDAEIIAQACVLLIRRYAETVTEWMDGIAGYAFTAQEDFKDYAKAKMWNMEKEQRAKRRKRLAKVRAKLIKAGNKRGLEA